MRANPRIGLFLPLFLSVLPLFGRMHVRAIEGLSTRLVVTQQGLLLYQVSFASRIGLFLFLPLLCYHRFISTSRLS